jgi:hypothetical protein
MYAMKMRSTAIERRAAMAVLEIPLLSLKRDLECARNEHRHVVLNQLINSNESDNMQVGKSLVFTHSPSIVKARWLEKML